MNVEKICFVVLAALLVTAGCGDDGMTPTDTGMDGSGDTGGGACDGAADGTDCADGICVGGVCGPSVCGDGYVDGDEDELCDDGNDIPGDGCEPDTCTPSCSMDEDCDDGVFCNGPETCNTGAGRCQASPTDFCDDGDPCTADSCEEEAGCANELIDVDNDGYSAETCTTPGLMGGDCDDTNFTMYPGADELCDSLDNNCDGMVDNGTVTITCYADGDRDTYGDEDDTVDACSCPAGYIARGGDCNDRNADVNPDHTAYETTGHCGAASGSACRDPDYDWNCDGMAERRYPTFSGCMLGPPGCGLCSCRGTGFEPAVACGSSGTLVSCGRPPLGICGETGRSRRNQECR